MNVSRFARFAQPLERVLADRLEHAEARLAVRRLLLRSRLFSSSDLEHVETAPSQTASAPRGGSRRRRRRAARTSACSSLAEQVVAPVDRAAQRLLARGQVARAARQQREPLARAVEHRLRRQQPDARRGQLDRERQPVQSRQISRDRRRVVGVSAKSARTASRPLDEQRDRVVLRSAPRRPAAAQVGQRQRWHRELVLAGEAQRRAARDEQLRRASAPARLDQGRAASSSCSKLSSTSRSLLAAQEVGQRLSERLPTPVSLTAECLGDRREHELRASERPRARRRRRRRGTRRRARPRPGARAASCRCRRRPSASAARTSVAAEQLGRRAAISRSRPISGVGRRAGSSAGFRASAAVGSRGEAGADAAGRAAAAGEVLEPVLAEASRSPRRSSSTVVWDSRTWPPCAASQIRAARWTSSPT